ncbi:hypothetical protein DH2020_035152 [Rehmannia glutinosa]|uniref:Auxin response factor n=1 Tax=Rehmannia glutinosa TaxID=99300 RepID=A0ABR0V8G1_REHGL
MANLSSSSSEVDASIWRAVAGAAVEIPPLNSYVYYFPEGHLEQSSSSASIHNYKFTLSHPFIPCLVLSTRFLSDPSSDQAFVKMLLRPLPPFGPRPINNPAGNNNQNDVVSFAKILTPSDANNGGGFSVPRFCADLIFPRLDFAADPPVQNLKMRDTHNNAWEFRHIYRGTPRRHLLTTGWSRFVNAKRLVAGDTVVFMRKKSTDEVFVGIRRAQRFNDDRDNREAILEAIGKAARGMEFEVVYYPKYGYPDFVVKAEKVKAAFWMNWIVGMRVRMAVDTDDLSRVTWIQGTLAATTSLNWFGSPWRMLLVNWDEGGNVQNMNRVCPWQVEYIPQIDHIFPPPSKKLKLMVGADGETTGGGSSSSSLQYYSSSPLGAGAGGIQGIRPHHICIPHGITEPPTVSTILTIGTSYSNNLSPAPKTTLHVCATDPTLAQPGPGRAETRANSFQLFGKRIQMS